MVPGGNQPVQGVAGTGSRIYRTRCRLLLPRRVAGAPAARGRSAPPLRKARERIRAKRIPGGGAAADRRAQTGSEQAGRGLGRTSRSNAEAAKDAKKNSSS